MENFDDLTNTAARAIWEAARIEDESMGPWEDAHESTREIACEDVGELVRILYPVFGASALRDAAAQVTRETPGLGPWGKPAFEHYAGWLRARADQLEPR